MAAHHYRIAFGAQAAHSLQVTLRGDASAPPLYGVKFSINRDGSVYEHEGTIIGHRVAFVAYLASWWGRLRLLCHQRPFPAGTATDNRPRKGCIIGNLWLLIKGSL